MRDLNINYIRLLFREPWYKSIRTKTRGRPLWVFAKKFMRIMQFCFFKTSAEIDCLNKNTLIVTYALDAETRVENHYMKLIQDAFIECKSYVILALPQFDDTKTKYNDNTISIGPFGDVRTLRSILLMGLIIYFTSKLKLFKRNGTKIRFNQLIDKIVALNIAISIYNRIEILPDNSDVYLPLEGNLWEFYLHKMKKQKNVNVTAYLNTVIFYDSFSIMEIVKQPYCDRWLDCGKQLKKFRSISSDTIGTRKFTKFMAHQDFGRGVIFLPEGTQEESEFFTHVCEATAEILCNELPVSIRYHPVVKSRSWGKKLIMRSKTSNLLSREGTLEEVLKANSIVVYCSSTSVIEATQAGLFPIFFNRDSEERQKYDVLYQFHENVVTSYCDLHKKILQNKDRNKGEIDLREIYSEPVQDFKKKIIQSKID